MPLFTYSHRVTYADCTIGDHIYYGRYLELLEAARGEFFRALGTTFLEWQKKGLAFPVIECRISYRMQAHYDDALRIEVWVAMAEGARVNFAHRILNEHGDVVLEAQTFHACTGLEGRPRRLPKELKASLDSYIAQPS
jgi:YbgC/YbaW family acyl-CoA thioester hydrolase